MSKTKKQTLLDILSPQCNQINKLLEIEKLELIKYEEQVEVKKRIISDMELELIFLTEEISNIEEKEGIKESKKNV